MAVGACQVSLRYSERLAEACIEPSVGGVGDSYDNALAETINGFYKAKVIHRRGPWRDFEAIEFAKLEWVEWFNKRRLLEPIGNMPPAEAKERYYAMLDTPAWPHDLNQTVSGRAGPVQREQDMNTIEHGGWGLKTAGAIGLVFGLLTVFSGGTALFGGEAARAAVGNAVPFVLWFNFIAGFLYVIAGLGLLLKARWAVRLSIAIALATALVLAAFGLHVAGGGLYEMRTVGAMLLRTAVWATIAAVAWRSMRS